MSGVHWMVGSESRRKWRVGAKVSWWAQSMRCARLMSIVMLIMQCVKVYVFVCVCFCCCYVRCCVGGWLIVVKFESWRMKKRSAKMVFELSASSGNVTACYGNRLFAAHWLRLMTQRETDKLQAWDGHWASETLCLSLSLSCHSHSLSLSFSILLSHSLTPAQTCWEHKATQRGNDNSSNSPLPSFSHSSPQSPSFIFFPSLLCLWLCSVPVSHEVRVWVALTVFVQTK